MTLREYMRQVRDDLVWAFLMLRIRRFRRDIAFTTRSRFDRALQPVVNEGAIAYPDAIYHATAKDFRTAREIARQRCDVIGARFPR